MAAAFGTSLFQAAFADEAAPSGSTSTKPDSVWRLSYGDVGKKMPLCQALVEEAKRQLRTDGGLCGFPIRPDDRRFGLVSWKRVAAKENLTLVKSIFAWFLLGSNYLGPRSYSDRQNSGPEILSADTVEDLWRRYSLNIPELIDSGELQLETASLRPDPAGTPLQVYRVTVLDPDAWPEIGRWKARTCTTPNNRVSHPMADLFFPLRSNRWQEFKVMNSRLFFGNHDIVLWNNRAYAGTADGSSISVRGLDALADGTVFYQQSTCEIRVEGE
jgi:hypothetical protein